MIVLISPVKYRNRFYCYLSAGY